MLEDIQQTETIVEHSCNTCGSTFETVGEAYECYLSHGYSDAVTRIIKPDIDEMIIND